MKNTKMRKIISVLMLTSVLNPGVVMAAGKLPSEASSAAVNVKINGVEQNIPRDYGRAYLDKNTNRVMVPARFVSESLGSSIYYMDRYHEYPDGAIFVGSDSGPIIMPINSNKYTVVGESERTGFLDSNVSICDGRTYVPIRFLSETMGHKVEWRDGEVLIEKNNAKNSAAKPLPQSNITEIKRDETSKVSLNVERKEISEIDKALSKKDYKNIYKNNLNNYRKANGLNPLEESEELNKVAKIRVKEEMEKFTKYGETDHNSPSGINTDLGENLYCWRTSVEEDVMSARIDRSFEAWKNSPGHNKNLLYKRAREYGYAYGVVEYSGKANGVTIYVFK